MVKIAKEAGQKCTLNKPLYCPKNGEHLMCVEIRMKAAAIKEEVMVTAPSPVIDTRQSRISVTVDEQLIKNLPVRRDIHDLINMVPGASFSESSG